MAEMRTAAGGDGRPAAAASSAAAGPFRRCDARARSSAVGCGADGVVMNQILLLRYSVVGGLAKYNARKRGERLQRAGIPVS